MNKLAYRAASAANGDKRCLRGDEGEWKTNGADDDDGGNMCVHARTEGCEAWRDLDAIYNGIYFQ